MNTAQKLRSILENFHAAYEASEGWGSDVYFTPPANHPMADAKYLMALADLRGRCGLS